MGSLRSLRTEAKEKDLSKHATMSINAKEVLCLTLGSDGKLRLSVLPPEEYPEHWNRGAKRTGGTAAETNDIRITIKDESKTDLRLMLTLDGLTHVGMEHEFII